MAKRFNVLDIDRDAFFMIPKCLLTHEKYADMKATSKLLYAVLLDKVNLSRKNHWIDDNGDIFFYLKWDRIGDILRITRPTISATIKELKAKGLLESVKHGFGKPDRLYLSRPDDASCVDNIVSDDVIDDSMIVNDETEAEEIVDKSVDNITAVKNFNHSSKEIELREVKNFNHEELRNLTTVVKKFNPNNNKYNNTEKNKTENSKTEVSKSPDEILLTKNLKQMFSESHGEIFSSPEARAEFTAIVLAYRDNISAELNPMSIEELSLLYAEHGSWLMEAVRNAAITPTHRPKGIRYLKAILLRWAEGGNGNAGKGQERNDGHCQSGRENGFSKDGKDNDWCAKAEAIERQRFPQYYEKYDAHKCMGI